MSAFYSDHFVLPLPEGHKFPMAKYSRLRERILAEGIVAPEDLHEAPLASLGRSAAGARRRLRRRRRERNGARPTSSGASAFRGRRRWSNARGDRSARRSPRPARRLTTALAANLAGGTHHAFADRGEGFCVFNDVAVAVRVLQRDRHARRIAIVDLDVHQGNGTAAIFSGDPSVFTFSMHGDKNFPFKKEVSDLDVPLADGTGDDEYLSLLRHAPADVLEPPSARLRLLSCGRRSVRGRSARAAEADHRRTAARATRSSCEACTQARSARRDLDERRLRQRHRRHRHHSRQHDSSTACQSEQWLNTFAS